MKTQYLGYSYRDLYIHTALWLPQLYTVTDTETGEVPHLHTHHKGQAGQSPTSNTQITITYSNTSYWNDIEQM